MLDFTHGLVKKPPISILHGLVPKKDSEKPSKQGEKQETKREPKVLTHPSGTVTGIDEETNLPIVRRDKGGENLTTPEKANAIGKEDPASGREVLHKPTDPDVIAEKAKAEHPAVKAALKEAISGVKGAKLHGDRAEKHEDRVEEKIEDEGQPAKTIPDYSGFRVAVDSHEAHHEAVDAIRGKMKVVREKDEFEQGAPDTAFHAHMLQVQQPDSDVTHEVQVLPNQVADVAVSNHGEYEKARTGDTVAAAEVKQKNEAAWKEFESSQGAKSDEGKGGRGESPEQTAGVSTGVVTPAALKKGDTVRLKGGQRATVAYTPSPNATIAAYRFKTEDGKNVILRTQDVERGGAVRVGGDDGKYIAVDLDKTLAVSGGKFEGATHIGKPIPAMVDRVKGWLAEGKDVRIFTARVTDDKGGAARKAIEEWSKKNIGEVLPITDIKDGKMEVLYDDRARQVEPNTGKLIGQEEPAA